MIASAALLRAWLAVICSVVCFALLIERAGLIPAVIVTVLVASRGSRDRQAREALLFGIGLAVAVSVLFVVLLNQPLAMVRLW
jgi:uncharacterized Tic20 family protein